MKFFLNPLGLLCIFMLFAFFLYWFKKRKAANVLFLFSTIWLLIISTKWLPDVLETALESQYPKQLRAQELDTNIVYDILVLGSGHTDDTALAPNDQLHSSALARLVEGVRIWHSVPKSRLITSGYSPYIHPSQAEILAATAKALGVDEKKIYRQDKPTITYEEAKEYVRIYSVSKNPLILVTSAYQMPRAMKLFRSQGIDPIPAPTFHFIKEGIHKRCNILPDLDYAFRLEKAIHEWVGLTYTDWWLLSNEEKENVKRFEVKNCSTTSH